MASGKATLRSRARENGFGHDSFDRGVERRRDRCLLCRDGTIERELDPTNLPDDFSEITAATQEPELTRIPEELIPSEQHISIIR